MCIYCIYIFTYIYIYIYIYMPRSCKYDAGTSFVFARFSSLPLTRLLYAYLCLFRMLWLCFCRPLQLQRTGMWLLLSLCSLPSYSLKFLLWFSRLLKPPVHGRRAASCSCFLSLRSLAFGFVAPHVRSSLSLRS